MDWPKELPGYTFSQSGDNWATYKSPEACGFHQSLRFRESVLAVDGVKPVVVEHGSSTCKMKMDSPDRYIITRTEVFTSLDRALAAHRGETETPKGKRKPVRIAEMSDAALKTWQDAARLEMTQATDVAS